MAIEMSSEWSFFFFFEQKGTLVLKEMLKIDSGPSGPDCTGGQDPANPSVQQQGKRRSSKKLGTAMCQIDFRLWNFTLLAR